MRKVNETLGYKADDNYTDFDAWKADAKAKGYRIEKDAPHTYSAIDAQGVDVGSFNGTGYFAESTELSRIKQLAGIKQHITESTPAFVATQLDDGTIFASHVHYDGYPSGLGAILQQNYTNRDKVETAIKGGDASSWGKDSIDYYTNQGESYADNAPQSVSRLTDLHGHADKYYLLTNKGWQFGSDPSHMEPLSDVINATDDVTNESMADILEKLRHVVTDSTKIDEWANSIESRTKDRGRVMELPAGEIIDNSLRRYLDAIPQKVTVVENQDISEAEMFSNYKKFAESANEIDEIDEANDDFEERPVYTNTETGKQTRYIPKDINTPPTRPKPRPNAPLVSPRPAPRP